MPWNWIERHCDSNAYRSAAFLQVWLRHRLSGGKPSGFVFAENGADVSFLAPLAVWQERHLLTPIRMLRPIGWDFVWPSVCVPFAVEHLRTLGHALSDRRDEWDVLEFAHATDDPGLLRSMAEALESSGLRVDLKAEPGYPYVLLAGSWEEYYRQRSANLRKNVSWLLNRSKRLAVRYERIDGDAAYSALEPLFDMHVRRWSSYGLPSVYSAPSYRRFMEALCGMLAEHHAIAVHRLVADRQTLAVAVCLEYGDAAYFYHTAFDEGFVRLSPGKMLLYFIIRDAFERGLRRFETGFGRERYKYWWTNANRTLCWFRVSVNRRAGAVLWGEDRLLRPVWRTAKRTWRRLRGYRPRPSPTARGAAERR